MISYNKCRLGGCRAPTTGGKQFCSEHVCRMPLARQIQTAVLAARVENIHVAWGSLVPHEDSQTSKDIIASILGSTKSRTTVSVARDLRIPKRAISKYVEVLIEAGRLYRSESGVLTVLNDVKAKC